MIQEIFINSFTNYLHYYIIAFFGLFIWLLKFISVPFKESYFHFEKNESKIILSSFIILFIISIDFILNILILEHTNLIFFLIFNFISLFFTFLEKDKISVPIGFIMFFIFLTFLFNEVNKSYFNLLSLIGESLVLFLIIILIIFFLKEELNPNKLFNINFKGKILKKYEILDDKDNKLLISKNNKFKYISKDDINEIELTTEKISEKSSTKKKNNL
jgi:hypothetical protein